jgi:dTDP-L-rhamnose 4-epimerase
MVGDAARYYGGPAWDSFDAVINLAAEVGVAQSMYEPTRYVNANTLDTIKLWEQVIKHKNIKRWVQASSMSIYGEGAYYSEGVIEYRSGLVRDVSKGWDGFMEKRPYGMEQAGRLIPLPTDETKTPEPASVYARTKLDQEQYSLLMGETYKVPTIALRFFGTYGEGQSLSNPYTGVAAIFACRALNGKPPLVFEDGQQRRDFVHVSDVARAVVAAVDGRV